jgi:hypothetical protein
MGPQPMACRFWGAGRRVHFHGGAKRLGLGAVALYLLLDVVLIAAVAALCQRVGWDRRHRLALAGGAALTYAWHAFLENPAVGSGGSVDRIGTVIFAAGLVVLLFFAARRAGPDPV